MWRCPPSVPILIRQKQVDLFETDASLLYIESSKTVRATQGRGRKEGREGGEKSKLKKKKRWFSVPSQKQLTVTRMVPK